MLCCCRTSSQISPVHNTKQNKCPLLIKPHNKCRPFVFPFILSTARGGCRGVAGGGGDLAYLGQLGAQKKVALLLSSAHCSSPTAHATLSGCSGIFYLCRRPACNAPTYIKIYNKQCSNNRVEPARQGRGGLGVLAAWVWVH